MLCSFWPKLVSTQVNILEMWLVSQAWWQWCYTVSANVTPWQIQVSEGSVLWQSLGCSETFHNQYRENYAIRTVPFRWSLFRVLVAILRIKHCMRIRHKLGNHYCCYDDILVYLLLSDYDNTFLNYYDDFWCVYCFSTMMISTCIVWWLVFQASQRFSSILYGHHPFKLSQSN